MQLIVSKQHKWQFDMNVQLSTLYLYLLHVRQTHDTHTQLGSLHIMWLSERGPITAQQNSQREPIIMNHASVRCGKLKLGSVL